MKVINEDESKIIVPPIKCQGIKTKLVPFIKENVKFDNAGTWIEPFVGTGVVVFNLQPQNALLSDKNQNIISFYKGIQDKLITKAMLLTFHILLNFPVPQCDHPLKQHKHYVIFSLLHRKCLFLSKTKQIFKSLYY